MRLDEFDDPMMAQGFFDFIRQGEVQEAINMVDYMSEHDADIVLALTIAFAAKHSQGGKH